MTKYLILAVSLFTTALPGFLRAESGHQQIDPSKALGERKQIQAERALFLKLKERINPKNFKEKSDYKAFKHR